VGPQVGPVISVQKPPATADAVIVGGGMIGSSTALLLARRGMGVVVCEKGPFVGRQSSHNKSWGRRYRMCCARPLIRLPAPSPRSDGEKGLAAPACHPSTLDANLFDRPACPSSRAERTEIIAKPARNKTIRQRVKESTGGAASAFSPSLRGKGAGRRMRGRAQERQSPHRSEDRFRHHMRLPWGWGRPHGARPELVSRHGPALDGSTSGYERFMDAEPPAMTGPKMA
jgi:hypothetical protein